MAGRIRVVRTVDVEAITAIYRPVVEATAVSFETVPPGLDEMALRVAATTRWYPWLVYELDHQVAGYAYATRHRTRAAYQWSVDTSVYVHSTYQRRGVGRGLYVSLCAVLAAQGYCNAYAGIALPNHASVRLHESVGFRPVGVYQRVGYKLGAWHDVGWWQLQLRPADGAPGEPLGLATVQGQPGWSALLAAGEPDIR